MDIGSVANFLAVVVEIAAIIVAIYQFKKTVDGDAKARREEAEAKIKMKLSALMRGLQSRAKIRGRNTLL